MHLVIILVLPFAQAMFTQPDTIIKNVYEPKDLNRYAYAYGNPYRYKDPDGHVAVGFEGFSGYLDDESGVDEIASQIYDEDSSISVQVFGHSEQRDALAYVEQQIQQNPNQPIVVYGHSFGGDSAIEFSKRLGREGLEVDELYLIDTIGVLDNKKPENVKSATNFIQASKLIDLHGKKVAGAMTRDMTKLAVKHTSIDNNKRLQNTIVTGTVASHKNYQGTKEIQKKPTIIQRVKNFFTKASKSSKGKGK